MSAATTTTSTTSRRTKIVLGIVGAFVALNVGLAGLDRITDGAQAGPESSSYTTGRNGLAAYAELLTTNGHPVIRLRRPIHETTLASSSTVVVLDAFLGDDDVVALERFVRTGGRLVAGGADAGELTRALGQSLRWGATVAGDAVPSAPVAEVAGVRRVSSPSGGVWEDAGAALPVLVGEGGALLVVATVGDGRIAFLASAAPLQNRGLDAADNAALGLALAGTDDRPVVFAEEPHGFAAGQGLGAVPAGVRWALAGLALAAVVWMIGRGRRLGPPEEPARRLPPPRRRYVEAMATTLGRTKDRRDSVASLQRASRDRIARICGIDPDADAGSVTAAARRLGLGADEAEAIVTRATDDAAVVRVGSAHARLESMSS